MAGEEPIPNGLIIQFRLWPSKIDPILVDYFTQVQPESKSIRKFSKDPSSLNERDDLVSKQVINHLEYIQKQQSQEQKRTSMLLLILVL